MSGKNSPLYIKDRKLLKISREKMYDTQYKYWMLSVKKRDGWKCKLADSTCKGQLEAHHILSWIGHPDIRYKLKNGITLCHAHHPRGDSEEKRLISKFQRLVSVSN
jgi:hypothetical protein